MARLKNPGVRDWAMGWGGSLPAQNAQARSRSTRALRISLHPPSYYKITHPQGVSIL